MAKDKPKASQSEKNKETSVPTDPSIANVIRSALRSNSSIDSDACKVTVRNGRATLGGFVPTYRQKKDILDIVEQINGVRGVDDKIRVKPASKAVDDDIREAVLARLKADPDIPANNISAVVKKGVVTLSGYIPSTPQSEHVRDTVLSVNGVLDVNNMLLVDPKIVRNDSEIAKDVVKMLYGLEDVDVSSVEVAVIDGQVVLSGKVDSSASAKRAVKAISGIRSVKQIVNKLTVT